MNRDFVVGVTNNLQPAIVIYITRGKYSTLYAEPSILVDHEDVLVFTTQDIAEIRGLASIIDWPTITYKAQPENRSVTPTLVSFRAIVNQEHDYYEVIKNMGSCSIRVDYYIPNTSLRGYRTLLIGDSTVFNFNQTTNILDVNGQDGEVRRSQFPPGEQKLNRQDFPLMSDVAAGRYGRSIVYGDFPYPLVCSPLDMGTNYYICDGQISGNVIVKVNGNLPSFPWLIRTGEFTDGTKYSKVQFDAPIPGEGDPLTLNVVTIEGGRGANSTSNPIVALIEDIGQYQLDPLSRAKIEQANLPISVLLGNTGDVLGIVNDRVMPQTTYGLYWRNGKLHIMDFNPQHNPTAELWAGGNTYPRLNAEEETTSISSVYNAVEIHYFRNPYSITDLSSSTKTFLMNKGNCPANLTSLLHSSVIKHKDRLLTLECPDIITNTNQHPDIIYDIAETVLKNSADTHRIFRYPVPWVTAYDIDIGWNIILTDESLGLNRAPFVVTEIAYTQVCPILTLQNTLT